ncbi:hypothetical protein N6L24_01775 [Cognatishimia sp. SS12]|uniref:hypothetical protein n=1 Tax=Cognatishimia sp. SS12 TaxID=2979465 RepID=UPI00232D7DD8|nr:hypothetical protein [Cognatishimia sp. SS12]MDC0736998.1 hypothetical protein [Cognatishimia sp. SS12]
MTLSIPQAGGLLALCAGLSACTVDGGDTAARGDLDFAPQYDGVSTRLLDGDLVNFHVEMRGARNEADVQSYAECAAAQYTLIRGYGFARHLRTTIEFQGGIWRGDAVYTISPALPRGLKTIDAEVTVSSCEENRIPTV